MLTLANEQFTFSEYPIKVTLSLVNQQKKKVEKFSFIYLIIKWMTPLNYWMIIVD